VDEFIIFGSAYLVFVIIGISVVFFARQNKNVQRKMLLLGIISFPLIFFISRLADWAYFNPRPFVVGDFIPLVSHPSDNGFPSDHALLSSSLASLVFIFYKRLGIFLFLLTVLVGLSRIAAGVHHGIDILGSIVIVVFVTLFAHKLLTHFRIKKF
jgi:undecaprenyl-diphosphatase